MSARVAALACEPHEREQGRVTVERALAIERKLMSGGRYRPVAGASPLDVIARARGAPAAPPQGTCHRRAGRRPARRRRRGAALRGSFRPRTSRRRAWGRPPSGVSPIRRPTRRSICPRSPTATWARRRSRCHSHESKTRRGEQSETNQMDDLSVRGAEEDRQPTTRIVVDDVELPEIMGAESDHRAPTRPDDNGGRADWFSAGDGEPEWPAFASPRREDTRSREPSKDRVRYLFPVPDATDWSASCGERSALYGATAKRLVQRGLARLMAKPSRSGRQRLALLLGREQVAVDLQQRLEVVDVLVQVGDADHRLRVELAAEVLDVARVALGERLVVGEVLGDPLGQVVVEQAVEVGLGLALGRPRRPRSGPC